MTKNITRRTLLAASAAAATGMTLGSQALAATRAAEEPLTKSLISKKIDEATMTTHKVAGFDGVECSNWSATPAEAEAARKIAERCGIEIHSVMRGWTNFNDPTKLEADIESVRTALAAAKGYGAGTILLVPCRTGKVKMPQPWEFDIAFDKKTGHIKRVVKGDNAPYADYIAAHDAATDASLEALKRLADDAEKAGVVIAVENVWSNLWVEPKIAGNLVRRVDHDFVRFYFDIGNHVKYSPPQDWLKELGDLIVRLHVKDFQLNENGQGGKFVDIRDGSVDWPLVRKTIDKIGYKGWMTIEGSGKLSVEERSRRLDLILAGK